MRILKNNALILILKLWEFSRVTLANSRTQTLPSFSKTLEIREREWEFSRFEGLVDRPSRYQGRRHVLESTVAGQPRDGLDAQLS